MSVHRITPTAGRTQGVNTQALYADLIRNAPTEEMRRVLANLKDIDRNLSGLRDDPSELRMASDDLGENVSPLMRDIEARADEMDGGTAA
ncbi:hypothetical protein BV394_02140 [Brevirhabdus pacifica]|uniref:Uncharacterized protein n=1 Tax=Brevirhabdus pacifica TaxID=1267768 RepID=A0A1U7DFK0_9RHOB|nr:hypothetical protein [Brevirhabdus pacifica]APX88679.1 hypothetical protein BV394_02140 [Brevirhabdus pacifica]OWU79944.1 hypothetical protein ATO5_02820 [Loktanella sp. 22II-4b]PJJ86816.1 hypothetical protein CLV77_1374 [Brevirhabdus pacifica]